MSLCDFLTTSLSSIKWTWSSSEHSPFIGAAEGYNTIQILQFLITVDLSVLAQNNKLCPENSFVSSGSHCCRVNRTKSGNALLYASDSCESDDYFECPHGSEDGKCANPATIFNNLVGDQRKYVSFWGKDTASARGGCCSPAYNQEDPGWGQAFKMYLKRPALQFATMSSSTSLQPIL